MSPAPVIVSCAITGSIHVPSQSPHLPITPQEIAEGARGAAAAGAAIVHLHARDPENGQPTPDPDVFAQFLPVIQRGSDVIINISTGGSQTMSLEERLAAARRFAPELCSLNMGSMNFATFPVRDAIAQFRYDWEPEALEDTRSSIFRNTFADIESIIQTMSELGTRFEFECYDVGHLYTLAHFLDRGLVEPPLFVQFVLGVLGGIGPGAEHLLHMHQTADRLFGDRYRWSVLGAGRHQMGLATIASLIGGNVRVGLEDSVYLERGRLATSNAEQVEKIIRILRELSLQIATPAQARELLGLKGAGRTAIPA